MAITASTVAKDRIYREDAKKSVIESIQAFMSSAVTFNQGDLIAVDTTAHVLKVVSATTDAANILGIAVNSVVAGKLKGPYDGLTQTDAAQAVSNGEGPVYGVTGNMKLKLGDTFHSGDKVYLADGQDSMTVSVTDPGDANNIGVYVGSTTTAVAGQEGPCKIGARFGASSLLF